IGELTETAKSEPGLLHLRRHLFAERIEELLNLFGAFSFEPDLLLHGRNPRERQRASHSGPAHHPHAETAPATSGPAAATLRSSQASAEEYSHNGQADDSLKFVHGFLLFEWAIVIDGAGPLASSASRPSTTPASYRRAPIVAMIAPGLADRPTSETRESSESS